MSVDTLTTDVVVVGAGNAAFCAALAAREQGAQVVVLEAAGEDEVAVEVLNDNPPMLLDEGAAINRTLCRLVGQTQTHGVSYASDAGVLRRDLGMECVLYGPGTIEVAHRPNEHVPIDEVRTAGATLDELVNGACRSA